MPNNNTTLIVPKTISELLAAIEKYPKSILFAGGTYVMNSIDYYPHIQPHNIISLANITELHKILHADRYIEVGAMVTIQQLLNTGLYSLPKSVRTAIEKVGTSILRNKITLGGCLCIPDFRYSLSCILATIQAQAEICFSAPKGLFGHLNIKSRWIPISKLYDSSGSFLYSDNTVLTRIRIPNLGNQLQAFHTIGLPVNNPETSLSVGFQYTISQDNVVNPSFCLSLIKNGFFCNQDFSNMLGTLKFPLTTKSIIKISSELIRLLKQDCPSATDVQLERSRRLLIHILFNSNNRYLET